MSVFMGEFYFVGAQYNHFYVIANLYNLPANLYWETSDFKCYN